MFTTTRRSTLLGAIAAIAFSGVAFAQELAPLNSDVEPDRMDWSQLEAKFGPMPAVEKGMKVGAVAKALTNEYWRSLGEDTPSLGQNSASL